MTRVGWCGSHVMNDSAAGITSENGQDPVHGSRWLPGVHAEYSGCSTATVCASNCTTTAAVCKASPSSPVLLHLLHMPAPLDPLRKHANIHARRSWKQHAVVDWCHYGLSGLH